jgi:hypothetical protein
VVPWPIFRFPQFVSVKAGANMLRLTVVVTVSLPEVPVMVSALVPVAAELLAVKVRMLLLVVGFGFQRAVTPFGSPETERVTLPVNPYSGVTVTEVEPDIPWPRFILDGAESVKVGAYTPSVSVVVAIRLPEVPVIVSVLVPTSALLLDVRVSVLARVVGLGEKLAVTPLGKPDTEKFTLPVNPYSGLTEMVAVLDVPWPRIRLPGPDSVKLGA